MFKSVGLVGNLQKEALLPLCGRIIRWCRRRDIEIYVEKELYDQLRGGSKKSDRLTPGRLKDSDLLCVMGGDGFLLHTVRSIYPHKKPLLTVNLGSLGFNSQAEPAEILKVLKGLYKKKIVSSKRFLLHVTPPRQNADLTSCVALNEVLLIKETRSRLIHVEVLINDILIGDLACDGIVVSSSTGSTAYNLSSGGPLVYPSLPVMTITPICPHTLTFRPIVIPSDTRISLRFLPQKDREEGMICLDGQVWWPLRHGQEVEITTAPDPILIAEVHPEQYYAKLRKKLHWGIPFAN